SFSLNADGSFQYTPVPNFIGIDSFSYKVGNGANESNLAMATISVLEPDHFPLAENDTETTGEDILLTVPSPGILGNDVTAPLSSVTAVLVTGPSYASSFTLNVDGSFSYLPLQDFNGVDSFAYRLFDGSRYSNVAMVTIEVIGVNDVPVAQGQG